MQGHLSERVAPEARKAANPWKGRPAGWQPQPLEALAAGNTRLDFVTRARWLWQWLRWEWFWWQM